MYEQIARNKRRAVFYVVLFLVIWTGVGVAVGAIAGAMSGAGAADAVVGFVIFAILAVLGILFTFSSGHKLVLSTAGAKPADPVQYRQLHDIVEALAIGDGLPKPEVYVIDDPAPNAFATGISPQKAAVTATTGLLQTMNREELEGVLGHEMSHIKNYDIRLLLVVSTLLGMAGLLASLIWRSAFYAGGGRRSRDGGQILVVIYAAGALLAIVAFVIGPVIRLALSRRRESLADVSGVELTRNPRGLISALQKLQANDRPFKNFNHATAAMCIDDPLQHHESWFHRLFDTHPPIAERIAVLEKIERGESL